MLKQKVNERKLVIAGLILTGLVLSVLAFTTEIPEGGADNYAHFNIARWAFRYPHLFLDHWGKPVYTILAAPFAQFGFISVRILNTILGLVTGWFVWQLAGTLKLEKAWFAVVVAIFTPIYFALMSTGMTEIVFSLILVLSVYLFFSEKYVASAALVSFLFLARTEGLAFELLFLIALLIKKQYRAIPLLATGFLLFSFVGLVYHYHDFWWLYNQRPYATGSPTVYGSGEWYHFIVRIPEYSGWIISVLLVFGTVVLSIKWMKEKLSLRGNYFLPVLLVLGTFWGYFFIHSYLWWKTETSAGLLRVMAGSAPMGGIIALYALQPFIVIPKKKLVSSFLMLISVGLVFSAGNYYRKLLKYDMAAEVLKRTTTWLKESGSLNHKMVMHNPYFSFSTEIDAWNDKVVQYGFKDNEHPENGLIDSTIFIWDALLSPNEGQVPLEKIMNNPNFEVVKSFDPLVPFKVMGNIDYKIVVFRKIAGKNIDNYRLIEELKREEFNKGIYHTEINDFQNNSPDQNVEKRRLLISSGSLNYVFSLDSAEFSPGFQINGDIVEKAIKNRFRISVDVCLLDSVRENRLLMVVSAESDNQSYYYETSDIDEQTPEINVWYKTEYIFGIPDELKERTNIKVYIWNIDKKNVLLDNLKLELAKQIN